MTELGIGDPRLVGYVAEPAGPFRAQPDDLAAPRRQGATPDRGDGDGRRGRVGRRRRSPARVPSPRRRLHALLDGRLSRGARQAPGEPSSPDHLIDYQLQGKRSYYLASTLDGDEAPVLRRLSDQFELCAFGLSRVRREWEKHDGEPARTARVRDFVGLECEGSAAAIARTRAGTLAVGGADPSRSSRIAPASAERKRSDRLPVPGPSC